MPDNFSDNFKIAHKVWDNFKIAQQLFNNFKIAQQTLQNFKIAQRARIMATGNLKRIIKLTMKTCSQIVVWNQETKPKRLVFNRKQELARFDEIQGVILGNSSLTRRRWSQDVKSQLTDLWGLFDYKTSQIVHKHQLHGESCLIYKGVERTYVWWWPTTQHQSKWSDWVAQTTNEQGTCWRRIEWTLVFWNVMMKWMLKHHQNIVLVTIPNNLLNMMHLAHTTKHHLTDTTNGPNHATLFDISLKTHWT